MPRQAALEQVNTFIEHVLRLIRHSFSEVGLSRLGINLSDQKMQLAGDLRTTLMEFKQAFVTDDADKLNACAEKLQGQILVAQTLSALNEAEANQLLDELYNLVEG